MTRGYDCRPAASDLGAEMEPPEHPYWPPTARIPGFAPNDAPLTRLLPALAAAAAVPVAAALRSAARRRLGPADRGAAAWFALCGFLHVAFEGYYVLNRPRLAGLQTTPAQLWKEYALSDSRYLTADAFTVCIETVTAFVWGPLCWLTLAALLRGSPVRHALQIVVCTAHLYGVALYFGTSWAAYRLDGVLHSRPEFLYFWLYFIGCNMPWAVVPLALLYDSFVQMGSAFGALREQQARLKGR